MARYIAIDHGTKRIGLAIGDRETGVVTPLDVVAACNEPGADVEAVLAVVSQYAVDALVVGLPLNMDDTEGPQAKLTRVFGTRLAEASDLPVHYQDERLSSFTADELLYVAPLQFDDNASSFPVQGVIDESNRDGWNQTTSFCDVEWRALEVIKLHGSVNWFADASDPEAEVICVGKQNANAPKGFDCQTMDFHRKIADDPKYDPMLIPPLLGKLSTHPTVRAQWSRALNAFRHARQITVVGYSFPETDAFMTRLLAEGIRTNDKLEETIIVNQEEGDDWWSRVGQMFARSWHERNLRLLSGGSFSSFAAERERRSSR